jgi:hypothetical protein
MKIYTTQELDSLETEKKQELDKIDAEIESLMDKRSGILLRMAEGEDETAPADLKNCDERIAQLRTDAEVLDLFLNKVLPKRKSVARGREIEERILNSEKKAAEIPKLVADINRKVRPLILAVYKLYDLLKELDAMPDLDLGLAYNFVYSGRWDMAPYGLLNAGVAGLPNKLDLTPILLHVASDPDLLARCIKAANDSIDKQVITLRKKASALKDADKTNPQ